MGEENFRPIGPINLNRIWNKKSNDSSVLNRLVIDFNKFSKNNSFSLELGFGWNTAFLESMAELEFIREAQKGLSNIDNYWIGGNTEVEAGKIIHFSQYRDTDLGNYMHITIINYTFDDYLNEFWKICHRFKSMYNF